jgi:hypothetical protein
MTSTMTEEEARERRASILDARQVLLTVAENAGITGYQAVAGAFQYLGRQFDATWAIIHSKEEQQ